MKSKIEIRHEAAKLAVKLPGTTIENFHDRAYRLELYLTGEAVLPETTNEADIIKMYLNASNQHKRLKSYQIAIPKKQRVAAKLPFYHSQNFPT